mgnify:CR=1 FL=1
MKSHFWLALFVTTKYCICSCNVYDIHHAKTSLLRHGFVNNQKLKKNNIIVNAYAILIFEYYLKKQDNVEVCQDSFLF